MGQSTKTGFTEYRYVRVKEEPLVRSLTFYFDVDQESETLRFSFASCSSTDNFCRETGRELAKEHFDNGDNLQCPYDRNITLVENAIATLKLVNGFALNSEEIRENIKSHPKVKKHYDEIIRAVSIHEEVKITQDLIDSCKDVSISNQQLLEDMNIDGVDGC